MDRPYGISDFAFPSQWDRESSADLVEKAGRSSQRNREHGPAERNTGSDSGRSDRGADRSRMIYRGRDREYSLSASEVRTLTDIGKFRVVPADDLARFGYQSNRAQMEGDVRNLTRQGLVERRTIERHFSYSSKVLTLTKEGHRLVERAQFVSSRQATYYGLVKPKEARHDADLYRLYQKIASEIERSGGKVRRVVLDFELKKDLYQALSRMRPEKDARYERIFIANQFDLKVVDGKIPIPDLRIEYEDDCREVRRLDLEIATRDYRPQGLGEKAKHFTCSPRSKTTLNCAAFSTPRKSVRGSLPYENSPHPHGSAPLFRLYGRGVPFPLPCGYAFRVFHLPAVSSVHQDETRQTQRRLCQEGCGKETRQLKGIPSAWPRLSSLRAESLYEAIGRENVRFRRTHSTEYIRTRLIALDFILRNQSFTYLESEEQKLSFFCDQLGIDKKILPTNATGAIKGDFTDRYFVDKFPMFYHPGVSLPPVTTFSFVDPGFESMDSFRTHLDAYLTLFTKLSQLRFYYVATRDTNFERAKKLFHGTFQRLWNPTGPRGLFDYFRTRRTWDEKNYGKLSEHDVLFMNQGKERFGNPGIENLYQRWRTGEITENTVRTESVKFQMPSQATFISATVNGQAALFERHPHQPVNVAVKSSEETSFPGDFTSCVTLAWR